MKFATFYFSGTGNTKWVIDNFDSLLKNRGHQSAKFAIDEDICKGNLDKLLHTIKAVDYIGFAYPLYGANMPRIMRHFIKDFFSAVEGAKEISSKFFFINTFAHVNGYGVFEAKKLLTSRSYKIYGYINCRLTNSAPSKKAEKALLGKALPSTKRQKATKKLQRFIIRVEKDKSYINGIGPHLLVGKIIRNALKDRIRSNYLRMKVDMKSCSKCMICVNGCPTKSIVFKDGVFEFLETCEVCMRCYHNCPQHSISNT